MFIRRFLSLLLLVAVHGVAVSEVVERHPDERLGRNVAELVAAINEGDTQRLRDYVAKRYAASMLRGMTVEDSAAFLEGVAEHRGPVELCCYQISDRIPEGMAVAYLHSTRLDSWSSLQIRFDADDKLDSLMIVPTKPPEGFAGLTALDDAGFEREFDRYLTELAAKDAFSGAVLVARDGKPLFSKAYGLANREHDIANRLDTKFRLGSMNKMFTAVAVGQLVERGKLSFDDPIAKHLPEGWLDPAVARKIRVRQLLNHTSGLGDYLEPMLEGALYDLFEIDDFKKFVAGATPAFEPGTQWAYSNTGFLLLGAIVAEVSGVDYYEYVRRNIYGPAGMKDSDHFDHTAPPPNLADGYFEYDGELRKNTLLLTPRGTSAGGGYSTVADLLAFDRALRAGKLVSSETRDLLFSPQPENNSPSYGYGFMVIALGDDREVGHGGTFPGTTAHLSMFLDSGYTFTALSNGLGAQAAYNKALALIERLKLQGP